MSATTMASAEMVRRNDVTEVTNRLEDAAFRLRDAANDLAFSAQTARTPNTLLRPAFARACRDAEEQCQELCKLVEILLAQALELREELKGR